MLSSCRDSWNGILAGSGILQRTYASVECGAGKSGLETHAVQILDEPRQIVASQARKNGLILVPAEKVGELWVKLWRSSIEVTELL